VKLKYTTQQSTGSTGRTDIDMTKWTGRTDIVMPSKVIFHVGCFCQNKSSRHEISLLTVYTQGIDFAVVCSRPHCVWLCSSVSLDTVERCIKAERLVNLRTSDQCPR